MAMEHGNLWLFFPLNTVIFHSYVKVYVFFLFFVVFQWFSLLPMGCFMVTAPLFFLPVKISMFSEAALGPRGALRHSAAAGDVAGGTRQRNGRSLRHFWMTIMMV